MLQDLTASELTTIRLIQHKELIGHDRRDMVAAKQAASVAVAGSTITNDQDADKYYRQIVKSIFPLEIPEREQTPEEIVAALSAYVAKTNGTEHRNTGG